VTAPYREQALTYALAGWPGVLPLPAREKSPVPTGYTGKSGEYTDLNKVAEWVSGPRGDGNVALRMPSTVVGIDVDAYGSKVGWASFKELLERCGDLPATWCSTSRDDGKSGIRFYQIPEGTGWRKAHSPEHIDIIRAAHRYAVVWPSIHPEGRQYRWIDPDGALTTEPPQPEWLPELPTEWLEELFPPEEQRRELPAFAGTLQGPPDMSTRSIREVTFNQPAPEVEHQAAYATNGPSPYVTGEAVSEEYFETTVEATLNELAALAVGSRNDELNKAAYKLGSFVPEFISRDALVDRLLSCCVTNGLVHDDGEGTVRQTIESGLNAVTVVFGRRPASTVVAAPWVPPRPAETAVDATYADPEQAEWDAFELMAEETVFEDKPWPIPELLPPGLGLLVAPPKVGKSFLALQLALAVATGTQALDQFDVDQGDVLYMPLEDGAARVKDRMKVLPAFRRLRAGQLTIRTTSARIDDGGLDGIADWCEKHPSRRLVIVDILQAFRSANDGGGKKNAYAEDYEALHNLRSLADHYGLSLLVVHHTKKGKSEDVLEDTSGSTGLTGATHYMITLKRKRNEQTGLLYVVGKDIADIELSLDFVEARWTMSDTPPALVHKLAGPTRRKVFEHLETHGPSYIYEIADALTMSVSSVTAAVKRLDGDGLLVRMNMHSPGKPIQWRAKTAEERAGMVAAAPLRRTTGEC
jgi:hypothetical protein